ncbi:MAG: trypsin-like peptidase domain-containing protein [Dehalococcoidia bacterium]
MGATLSPTQTTTGGAATAGQSGSATTAVLQDRGAAGAGQATGATAERLAVPDLVKRVRPSVVQVRASAGASGAIRGESSGSGTGFVIDDRGYIVTNNHVVTTGGRQPARNLQVDLADGRSLEAKLIGRDELTDLAVLKVEATNLAPVKFADPRTVEVGDDVVAVGFALSLGATPTVTRGVISALDREINERLEDGTPVNIGGAIQTDAAINPGNSGGPLLNLAGQVVGINTAGLVGGQGRSVQGISFAVSSQVAIPVVKALIDNGQVKRGYLGVLSSPVTKESAGSMKLPVSEGARLTRVDSGTPADRAGLKAEDIIVKIGATEVRSVSDVSLAMTQYGPNQKVSVEYVRGNDRRTTDVTLGERPADLR